MLVLSPSVSWNKKNGVVVVYHDFNYYFFKNEMAKWFLHLVDRPIIKNKKVPSQFINYLIKEKIFIS